MRLNNGQRRAACVDGWGWEWGSVFCHIYTSFDNRTCLCEKSTQAKLKNAPHSHFILLLSFNRRLVEMLDGVGKLVKGVRLIQQVGCGGVRNV